MGRIEHTPDGTIYTDATTYEVSCLPQDHNSRRHFTIKVEWRGPDSWAVLKDGHMCADKKGVWDWESQPSSRTEKWLKKHRFKLSEALALARELAPTLTIMGKDVQWAVAHPEWL